jgi:alanyl-tRNA synthetase
MNFHQLYYEDPYRTAFDAQVLSCDKKGDVYEVILDQTCFYPEGGGQASDRGVLSGLPVLDVQERSGSVVHTLSGSLPVGSTVHGEIEFDFRYRMMQQHTAEHILSGLAHHHYGCENVGFHMTETVTTLDLDRPLSEEQLAGLEREANEIVFSNAKLQYLLPKEEELEHLEYRSKKELEGDVRIVRIPGADDCACCGLHVRRTGEIGLIKILSFVHYKGGVRIEMTAGRSAVEQMQTLHSQISSIGRLLSVKPEKTESAVKRVLNEEFEKDRRIAAINQRYFESKAASYSGTDRIIICLEEGLNRVELRKFCDLLVKRGCAAVCAVLCEETPGSVAYCIGSASVNLREAAPALNASLNGKGGGSPAMIQGTFRSAPDTVASVIMEHF